MIGSLCVEMEKLEKSESHRGGGGKQKEADEEKELLLRWGNRKKLRCVRVRDSELSDPSYVAGAGGRSRRRKITSEFVSFSDRETSSLFPPSSSTRNSETGTVRRRSPPEDNYWTGKGSTGPAAVFDSHGFGKAAMESGGGGGGGGGEEEEKKKGVVVWPKLYTALSSKEKEEDYMAMKGCKLPHRPKKRSKLIQRTLLLVSPGAWLSELCQERYEVREKKCSKKRPRGLKAMGSLESDSE